MRQKRQWLARFSATTRPTAVMVIGAVLASVAFVPLARAQYEGVSITCPAYFPDAQTLYDDPGPRVVSNSLIEYPVGSYSHYNPHWQVDITASQMIMTWTSTENGNFFTAQFNGWIFTHASGPLMQLATVDPASDFSPVSVSVQGNRVLLNYAGVQFPPVPGTRSIINFNVPEPATTAVAGLALMLFTRPTRRGRRARLHTCQTGLP